MEQSNNKNIELIDKFLAGQLSEEEVVLFEAKRKNPEFEKEFKTMQKLKAGISTFELRRIKSILEEEEKKIRNVATDDKSKKIVLFNFRNILKIAAILIGVSVGTWWLNTIITPDQPTYFAEYFTPQTSTSIITKSNTVDVSLTDQIYNNYENKNYTKFLTGIDTLIIKNDNDDHRFYQANALLATDQVDSAILVLEQIIQRGTSNYLENAKWYLALAYLQKKQIDKARPLLEASSNVNAYRVQVEEILEGME